MGEELREVITRCSFSTPRSRLPRPDENTTALTPLVGFHRVRVGLFRFRCGTAFDPKPGYKVLIETGGSDDVPGHRRK
jgi:hypothetical protein